VALLQRFVNQFRVGNGDWHPDVSSAVARREESEDDNSSLGSEPARLTNDAT